MKLFIAIIISLLTVSIAVTKASAESTKLSSHGEWTVYFDYYEDRGILECSMGTFSDYGSFFLSVTPRNTYSIYGYAKDTHVQSSTVDINLLVGTQLWELEDLEVSNEPEGVFWIRNLGESWRSEEFRQDMISGSVMSFKTNGSSDIIYSLSGSAAAMSTLEECRKLITLAN